MRHTAAVVEDVQCVTIRYAPGSPKAEPHFIPQWPFVCGVTVTCCLTFTPSYVLVPCTEAPVIVDCTIFYSYSLRCVSSSSFPLLPQRIFYTLSLATLLLMAKTEPSPILGTSSTKPEPRSW